MARKYFGTDGIRGLANGEKLTPELAMRVGMAAGLKFVRGDHRNRVVIGKDTRRSGYMIENARAAGFTARETDVIGVEVPDQPGELARIMALFRDAGLAIEYLYASLEHRQDKAVIVIKVIDIGAALAMLEKNGCATVRSF